MYNFPMPTEVVKTELAEAKAKIDAALRLHTPERRYTAAGGEASWDTADDCAAANEIPVESVEHFDVCAHCRSIEMGDEGSEREYASSMWPCSTAKALGVTS
jgi:hypothetical protein